MPKIKKIQNNDKNKHSFKKTDSSNSKVIKNRYKAGKKINGIDYKFVNELFEKLNRLSEIHKPVNEIVTNSSENSVEETLTTSFQNLHVSSSTCSQKKAITAQNLNVPPSSPIKVEIDHEENDNVLTFI